MRFSGGWMFSFQQHHLIKSEQGTEFNVLRDHDDDNQEYLMMSRNK
jgi:hypothetical protein